MNIQFKKWMSLCSSMCMTWLLCLSIPLSYASDRDIYKTASNGNITVMLTLDQSLSMSLPTWSITACDAPDGYTEVAWAGDNTNGYDTFANQYSTKHAGKTYSYKRFFCTAKPPIVKSRAYYTKINNVWNIRYQLCTNNVARYEDCRWGLETAAKPANSGALVYLLPGGVGFQTVWVYFDKNSTKVKLYDRMTRVKDGIYELLYGAKPLDDDKGVGVSFFPVSATKAYKGHISVPARPLKEVVGATNQRDLVMKAVANMGPMGVTPLTNVYADVAAYFLGTNTLRRPLQNLVAVQRIEWKRCEYGIDHRTADGSCKEWYYSKDDWFKVGLPASFWTDLDVNNVEEAPLSVCRKDLKDATDLQAMTNCYTQKITVPRYVMAIPVGETDYSKAVWRTCVSWKEDGLCNALDYWRPDAAATSTGYTTWSTTKPNDPRLILNFSDQSITAEQKANAYVKISSDDFKCPTTGTNVDSSYKITCFGAVVDAPAFAVKRIIRPKTIDNTVLPVTRYGKEIDAGSPDGVWKLCTSGNDTDGTCKAGGFTPAPLSVNNGSVINSTDGRYPNKYDYWSNIKPSEVTSDLESTFCSEADLDSVPGNETGATGICYFKSDSVYAKHVYADTYAGFIESVSESKNMTSTDVLQQTYKRPDAVTTQMNSTQQCGGQGIYMLTDGEPNGSGAGIQRALYRAALTSSSTTTTARNFNCSNPDFGGANTMWGCAANFSKLLLNSNASNPNPINMPIRTATVGFGGDYADLPPYDSSKSVQENAALIKDFYGVSDERKGLALLGIYGEGGWYKGSSTGDVVNSILEFFKKFAVDIPPLNTGTVAIPVDGLNPTVIQNFAYYPEFKPTPDSSYPLWFGNLKRYKVYEGAIKDNSSSAQDVLDAYGNVNTSAVDMWARGAKQQGALYRIPLRISLDDSSIEVERKLLVNMAYSDGNEANAVASKNSLMVIDKQHITSGDPNRGYLAALLGYSISKAEADTPNLITSVDALKPLTILRQMGGAIHSSPVLLTQSGSKKYITDGSVSTTDRVEYLAFGTAQGLLQVVSATTGQEKFAFVPFEMVERQKQGFIDRSLATGVNGIYDGIDGAWTAYAEYVPKGENNIVTVNKGINSTQGKQWIYGGLRMGGRSYYALDLSDIDLSDIGQPKLKFHINPDADSNLVTVDNVVSRDSLGQPLTTPKTDKPISYMGQSWSKPTLTYVNWKGKRKLVMLVGGGYDMGYEADNYEQSNGIGAGVYMFDADNGDLLWWSSSNPTASTNTGLKDNALKAANMKYSVVGRINTLDRNNDGLTDHLYFADLGGQLWRVDIDNKVTGNDSKFATRATRLLNLHATANDGTSPRFYEAPNVSVYSEPGVGRFVAVTLGSGNRSQPLSQYTSTTKGNRNNDAVFVVYDKDVGKSDLYDTDPLIKDLVLSNLTANADKVTGTAIPYSSNGWYYSFSSQYVQSAKVMGELVSINKNLYVPVYDASKDGTAGSCGTGVKGVTIVHRLCLPYGKCEALASGQSNELFLGSGLLGVNIGSGSKASSMTVIGGSCDAVGGVGCKSIGGVNPSNSLVKKEHVVSRIVFPTRWYEQIAKD